MDSVLGDISANEIGIAEIIDKSGNKRATLKVNSRALERKI
jgi:hypothetical protein